MLQQLVPLYELGQHRDGVGGGLRGSGCDCHHCGGIRGIRIDVQRVGLRALTVEGGVRTRCDCDAAQRDGGVRAAAAERIGGRARVAEVAGVPPPAPRRVDQAARVGGRGAVRVALAAMGHWADLVDGGVGLARPGAVVGHRIMDAARRQRCHRRVQQRLDPAAAAPIHRAARRAPIHAHRPSSLTHLGEQARPRPDVQRVEVRVARDASEEAEPDERPACHHGSVGSAVAPTLTPFSYPHPAALPADGPAAAAGPCVPPCSDIRLQQD